MDETHEKPILTKFDYYKANWENMNKSLAEIDWQTRMTNLGINQKVKLFIETIETACNNKNVLFTVYILTLESSVSKQILILYSIQILILYLHFQVGQLGI